MKLQTHTLFPLTQTPISEYSGVRINEAIAKDNTTTEKLFVVLMFLSIVYLRANFHAKSYLYA